MLLQGAHVYYKTKCIDSVRDKIFQPLAAVQEKKLIMLLLRNIQHSPFSSFLAAFQINCLQFNNKCVYLLLNWRQSNSSLVDSVQTISAILLLGIFKGPPCECQYADYIYVNAVFDICQPRCEWFHWKTLNQFTCDIIFLFAGVNGSFTIRTVLPGPR